MRINSVPLCAGGSWIASERSLEPWEEPDMEKELICRHDSMMADANAIADAISYVADEMAKQIASGREDMDLVTPKLRDAISEHLWAEIMKGIK